MNRLNSKRSQFLKTKNLKHQNSNLSLIKLKNQLYDILKWYLKVKTTCKNLDLNLEGKRLDILKSNRNFTEFEPEVKVILTKRKKEDEVLRLEKLRHRKSRNE